MLMMRLEEDGIPYIFIRPNEHRTLKTPQSRRLEFRQLVGFLRYRSEIKSLGYRLLSPKFVQQVIVRPWADVSHGDDTQTGNILGDGGGKHY